MSRMIRTTVLLAGLILATARFADAPADAKAQGNRPDHGNACQ